MSGEKADLRGTLDLDRIDFEAMPHIEALLMMANQDSDAASVAVLGENLDEAQGAIVIIKGRLNVWALRAWLIQNGMLTNGKPVVDPVPELGSEVGA